MRGEKLDRASCLSVDTEAMEPHSSTMKRPFTLPDSLARQFQSASPQSTQSQAVAGWLAGQCRAEDGPLAQACRGVNSLTPAEKDMEGWEAL